MPVGPSYTLHSTRYLIASILLPYATLVPLAVAGFLVIFRGGGPPVMMFLMAASIILTSVVFFPQERFRLPVIDPLLIIGAGAALSAGNRRIA